MGSQFESLPNEVLGLILQYVPLLSDLKSLCQVSRAVCAISTPALYRDLELEYKPGEGQIDSVWVRRIAGPAMNSTHGGLQFVRNLRANFPDCWPLLLGDLLGSLPDDSLIEFEHRATFTLKSSQYIARMWKHQSNLRNITFTLDLLDFVEQHKTQVEMPKHLNKLVFIGAHIWQLDRLLSSFHFPCLRKVSLEQYGQDLGMDDHTKLDALVSNHLGLLTHLKLRRVGTSGLVGLDLNKLPRLTHLTLIDCSHMHITPSIAAWRKPALTDLHIIISDSRSEFTLMDELSQMLHRFRGLESLALKCNEIMTAETSANLVAGIILHKDTLHRLALNTYNEGPNKNAPKNALNSLSFVLAVKQCKNLTQLQMPFLPDAPLLELVQSIIASLPHLEIMNIHIMLQFGIAIKPLVKSLFTQFSKLGLLFCGTKDWFETYVRETRTGVKSKFAFVRPQTAKYYLPQKEQIEWFFTPDFHNSS